MNRYVAGAFASILSLVHVAVLLALGGMTLMLFSDNKRQIAQITNMFGVTPEAMILLIIAIWVGYVLVMGFLATVIAMNENLERLNKSVEALAAKMPG